MNRMLFISLDMGMSARRRTRASFIARSTGGDNSRSQASLCSSLPSTSSRTLKLGETPVSSGNSLMTLTQNAWNVDILHQLISSLTLSHSSPGSFMTASRTRCFISAAAFSVNVRARISGTATPLLMRWMYFSTSVKVLPAPAPAVTHSERERSMASL